MLSGAAAVAATACTGSTTQPAAGSAAVAGWSPAATPERSEARIFISGHSLTEPPLPHYLAEIADSLGTSAKWNQQSLPGSSLRDRTRGAGDEGDGWSGYRRGANREGQDLDIVAELREPRTIDDKPYDVLVVTEIDALLDFVILFDTVRYLRHFHDRLTAGNPAGSTYVYESWLGIHDKDRPQRWIAYERAASPVWQCLATRINVSLAHEGKPAGLRSLPAGAALASLIELATGPGLPGITATTNRQTIDRLFADEVHLKPLGHYYVALVAYATIYRRSPIGAWRPNFVSPQQALSLQQAAWRFVADYLEHNRPMSLDACRDYLQRSFLSTYLGYQRDTAWKDRGTAYAYALWAKHQVGWRRLFSRASAENPFHFDAQRDGEYWFDAP